MSPKAIIGYLSRFSLLHLFFYFAIGALFLMAKEILQSEQRLVLDYFRPFEALSLSALGVQLIRGLICALILLPFYRQLITKRGGWLILFGAMWGLGFFGSVEPMPGSIEGMIYTIATWPEHLLALLAVGLQMVLFSLSFVGLERKFLSSDLSWSAKRVNGKIKGFLTRFSLLHLISYFVVGSIFYELSGYEEALATMELFSYYRPLESIGMVGAVIFGQLLRGPMLAVLLWPFYAGFIKMKWGWLRLFSLLFGFTVLASPIFLRELLVFELSLVEYLETLTVGIPEIFFQMLIFSVIFFYWQRRVER